MPIPNAPGTPDDVDTTVYTEPMEVHVLDAAPELSRLRDTLPPAPAPRESRESTPGSTPRVRGGSTQESGPMEGDGSALERARAREEVRTSFVLLGETIATSFRNISAASRECAVSVRRWIRLESRSGLRRLSGGGRAPYVAA